MSDRLPDRGSVWWKNEEPYTVVDLTKRHVRLVGPTGTDDVPLWEWPKGYVAGATEEDEDQLPIQALLVGGEAGRHLDRIEAQSRNVGVDIVAHWPMSVRRVPSKQIPSHIELVIYLTSHVAHSIYEPTKAMAQAQGIPSVHVPSQAYEHYLSKELDKIGMRKSRFGATDDDFNSGRYTWTGSTWSWTEGPTQAPVSAVEEAADAAGDLLLSTFLTGLTLAGLLVL